MNNRLAYLDNMRAIAIVMVVVIHSIGYAHKMSINQKEIVEFIVHTIAVPVFFFVDGYLYARKCRYKSNELYLEFVKKSFFRLLLPWFYFTLFYALIRWFFESIHILNEKLIVGRSFMRVMVSMYGSVYAPQMYFLFSLFLVRLFSPILKKSIKFNPYSLFVGFGLYLVLSHQAVQLIKPYLYIQGGQEPILHALWGGQFYFLGILVLVTEDKWRAAVKLALLLNFIMLLLFKFFVIVLLSQYIIQYTYILFLFFFFLAIKDTDLKLNSLGRNTMGIYLIHAPILLNGVARLVNPVIKDGLLSLLVISSSCLLASYILSRSFLRYPASRALLGEPWGEEVRFKTL